ncbi:MAG: ISNCY family transposase [Nitrospirota bacterium]
MIKLAVTMRDIQRYKVLAEVIDKKLSLKDAAEVLALSYRQAIRLKQDCQEHGLEGILRRNPAYPPNKKITDKTVSKILKLREDIYYDFNIMHFMEKLDEIHGIHLSYESVRKILIMYEKHKPKERRVVHRQRRRMPKAGMLVQMDSSQHRWLEHIPEKWWLVAMIDDATNEVAYAGFFPKDTVFANMHIIRRFIEIKGIFMSLYVDKASHFTTTRIEGIHYSVSQEQEDTQIERALQELGITLIPANSPQAKGRIEVTFRLFQDRLIKEMRLAGVKNYDEANSFLIEKFLPWYNARYTHEAESAYMPVPKGKDLDLIFCIKRQRTVNKDNTISFNGQVIQIPPTDIRLSFAKTKVDVCLLEDNRIFILYKDQIITETTVPDDNDILIKEKKIDDLLNERQYVRLLPRRKKKPINIPSLNHPWRRYRTKTLIAKKMKNYKTTKYVTF